MRFSPPRRFARAAALGLAVVAAVAGSAPAQSEDGSQELQAFYGPKGDPNVYCSGACGTGICCIVTPLRPST